MLARADQDTEAARRLRQGLDGLKKERLQRQLEHLPRIKRLTITPQFAAPHVVKLHGVDHLFVPRFDFNLRLRVRTVVSSTLFISSVDVVLMWF